MRTGLYRVYDAKTRLLYVGISDNPLYRTQTHSVRSPWWFMADAWSVQDFATREEAEKAEFAAARDEGPLYNINYNEWFKGSAGDARRAIPEHLERKPVQWRAHGQQAAPKPYRIRYWDWGGRVENLSMDQARGIADTLSAIHPEWSAALTGEAEGVPEPWGHHAIVGYAVRKELVSLSELTGLTPEVFRRIARAEGVERLRPPTVGKLKPSEETS